MQEISFVTHKHSVFSTDQPKLSLGIPSHNIVIFFPLGYVSFLVRVSEKSLSV